MWTKLLWCLCTEGRRAGFLSWWTWNILPLVSALVTRFRQTKKGPPFFLWMFQHPVWWPQTRLSAAGSGYLSCERFFKFNIYIYIYADFCWNWKQLSCLIINVNKLTDRQMSMCVYWVRVVLGPNVGFVTGPFCPPPPFCVWEKPYPSLTALLETMINLGYVFLISCGSSFELRKKYLSMAEA